MNTGLVRNVKRIDKIYLYISLSLFLFLFIFFILIKVEIFQSMDSSIQNSLQPDYSDFNDIKIPKFISVIYYFNKIYVPYSIIIIVNNFSNIYNIFNLFQILSITCYISCILKFIFYKIINNENKNPLIYYCGEGWNLPSTEMMISVVFYLTLWDAFFNHKEKYANQTKKVFKFVFLFIIIGINIINLIFLTKIGYYLFSHLLFSILLGVLIYIFVFKTNIVKYFNSRQFCIFIKKKFQFYMLVNIILLILTFLPYNIERNIKSNDNDPECISIDGSFFYKSKSPFKTYVDDTYSLISIFFAHIFFVVGIKCELAFFFENHIQNFEQYHFGFDEDELNNERESNNKTTTIIVTRETEWNNTTLIKSLIRLFLTFVLAGICFLPYFLINKDGVDFSTIFLIKYFLSYFLFSFGISFLYKIIFRVFKLSNEILGSILNDQ